MIEINLLPEELRKKESRSKKFEMPSFDVKDVPILKIIAATFAGLFVLQAVLFMVGIYGKAALGGVSKRYETVLPQKKEADDLKLQVDTINKKVGAIDELMVKRFEWAKKLGELSDSMTPGIWLSALSYDEKMTERAGDDAKAPAVKDKKGPAKPRAEKMLLKYITISGYASSMGEEGTASIGRFIKSLKDNRSFYSDFSDIELGTIKRDKLDNQEVMSFNIACYFKESK